SSTGRNVDIAPSANTQTLGLISWKAAACPTPSGRATWVSRNAPDRAIDTARERRYADPMTRIATPTAGWDAIKSPGPAPTAPAMTPIPMAVPRMCGAVRRNPKVEPDASSRTLLGPGVTELTIE